ncbi:MAG: DUF5665 domain-containing protein [Clostridiales bacterium]|nr:DUF5665 domain-containing protein [Clostridiales bacterium]MCF8022121.1 DUF5665 domain-containing protein [Clostridiales bacterium]
MENDRDKQLNALEKRLEQISQNMERMNLTEYIRLLESPWKLLYINFISGLARGLGIAVGFAILGAVVILLLQKIVKLNLPLISEFIANLVELVRLQLQAR